MELKFFINFINETFNGSCNKFLCTISKDYMLLLTSEIGSQYFKLCWSSVKKDYIISVTTATPGNKSDRAYKESPKPEMFYNHTFFRNSLNRPIPTIQMYQLKYFSKYVMRKLMVYFCIFMVYPRKTIEITVFQNNMKFLSGLSFDKNWYKSIFNKKTINKMCNDIFNQEITCKSGNYGIPSIHCYLNKSELWLKIEENIEVYNKFGFKQINLSTLRSAKLLDKNYCCDIKTWIPFNVNSIILFVFDAKDIYENN